MQNDRITVRRLWGTGVAPDGPLSKPGSSKGKASQAVTRSHALRLPMDKAVQEGKEVLVLPTWGESEGGI
jgi:hypothetical protein